MKSHVEILGWIYVVHGMLKVLAGVGLLFFFASLAILPKDPTGTTILLLLATVIPGFLLVVGAPEVIGGIGLLKFKSWARVLAIILGVLNLFAVPIGTAIGIYAFWVLSQQEIVRLFEPTDAPMAN